MPATAAPTRTLYPTLRYADARAAIAWLRDALGFAEHFVVEGPNATVAHAQLTYGTGMIMLGSAVEDELAALGFRSATTLDGLNQAVYVAVDDIDDHFARAKSAGAIVVRELRETEYGSREYAVRDPEGNVWFIGTYRP